MKPYFVVLAILVSLASTGAALAHDHSKHNPLGMDGWSPDRIISFRIQSDAKIDQWAGRTVAPGETITYEGLTFRKSTADDYAQKKKCKWCPTQSACH